MYSMSRYEFIQYELAEKRLNELKQRHAIELEHAYDSINPTLTCFDYSLGELYSSSVNPANYAIYLVELQEKHKQIERYWDLRAKAYKKALSMGNKDKTTIKSNLETIIASNAELQRKKVEELTSVEEYDKRVDSMTDKELFEGYYNLDEQLEQENISKCLKLYKVHGMTFKEISSLLGITSTKAREIILQAE